MKPDNPESEVDKVVKYILDSNILVRHVSVKYDNVTQMHNKNVLKMMVDCSFRRGRFSKNEDGKIEQKWDKLTFEVPIKGQEKCIEDFTRLKGGDPVQLQRRTVLGCYLAQDLPYVRHGADVFNRATRVLYFMRAGHFTPDEDAMILKEVETNGAYEKTWVKLGILLKRGKSTTISQRYTLITEGKLLKTGNWDTEDYSSFFSGLFGETDDKTSPEEFIRSITKTEIYKAANFVNRLPSNVRNFWTSYIKPVLLAYHCGMLHSNWKREFLHYVSQKEFTSQQDIIWEDAIVLFPCHSGTSLKEALTPIRHEKIMYAGMPLYLAVRDYLQKSKHQIERRSSRENRDKIVFLYDKARGVASN